MNLKRLFSERAAGRENTLLGRFLVLAVIGRLTFGEDADYELDIGSRCRRASSFPPYIPLSSPPHWLFPLLAVVASDDELAKLSFSSVRRPRLGKNAAVDTELRASAS